MSRSAPRSAASRQASASTDAPASVVSTVVGAVDVAPDQAQRLAQAKAAQGLAQRRQVGDLGEHPGARVGVARIGHQLQEIRAEQLRNGEKALVGEVTGQQHALQVVVDAGVVVEGHARLATGRFEPRQALVQKGDRGARPGDRKRHAPIVAGRSPRRPERSTRRRGAESDPVTNN